MSAAAQNNPQANRARHCQSLTPIDPYVCPLEQLCFDSISSF
jgi:hypothetical protein